METRIRRSLLGTFVGIVMISCCISGVASDIPDDVVYTDLHKNVRIGDSVVLRCQFRGTPLAVYWKKGDDPRTAPNLVSWIPTDNVTGLCEGDRPCRIMEMNEDRSLVIKEVSIAEQGRYICRVSSYRGILIHNFTDIHVFSPPKKPYPFINECLRSPAMKSNQTCIISTTEDPINISCTASGYFPDLDLFFIHGSQYITTIYSEETTNEDGKKNKSITSQAFSSPEPYVCVASDIPGVEDRSVASVLVTTALVTTALVTPETAPLDRSDSTLAVQIAVPLTCIVIFLLVAAILRVIIPLYIRQQEPVSYVELWKLVDEGDPADVKDIVSELVGNPEGNTAKEDLYRKLCEWKERSSGNVKSLYRATKKLGFHDDLKRIKDFRASASVSVSDDDLAHICWHVRSCEETVNPILRALHSTDRQGRRPIFSTSNIFDNEFQMMKRWKSGSVSEKVTFCSGSEEISRQVTQDDEITSMGPFSVEVQLTVNTIPPNQTIRLCLALEEAGKTVDERHRPVYLRLAKTFFQIRDEYKSALTDRVLKTFALFLTKRHCQRLGNTLGLPENVIAARNEDDLGVIFRTDAMLRDWVLNQKCSYYDIRRRLRQTAERCNRHDIHDVFIPKDQSNIMPLMGPDYLTRADDNQCPRNSVSDGIGDISRDEVDRIRRYAGSEALLELRNSYETREVQEQRTSEMSEGETPLLQTSAAGRLWAGLGLAGLVDYTLSLIIRQPRDTLREILGKRHTTDACLIPLKRNDKIFEVEFIELAFRLVMADVHPFAEDLGISDQLLTSYKPNFEPKQLDRGTIMMLKDVNTKDRFKMFDVLRTAGYSEEANAIYFGFEISLGDMLEVENQVDMAELANKLGLSEDVQPMGQANEISCGERQNSVLFRWKDTVRSSTFNHRLVLSDTIFSMGKKELALNIISGVYRKRVINDSLSELLANTMNEEQLSTLCGVLDQKGTTCQNVITAWAGEITKRSTFDMLGKYEKKPRKLSNELLQNGFYHFAYEIMAGAWQLRQ